MSEPSEEQLREQLEEQIKQLRVEDVLLQTIVTLVNLAGRKLGLAEQGEKDLEQARLGIEAVRALLPLCPQDQVAPIKDALSQLQMLFARETQQPGEAPPAEEKPKVEKPPQSKIWTPPGT